jgi:L-alanine-DL-glutamate epimerase-like enolase superfamily enzyme
MKIISIDTIHVRIPFTCGGPIPIFAGRTWDTVDTLLVKISTDTGITGWGEAFGHTIIPATRVTIDSILAPLCLGRDATQIDALLLDLHQRLHIFGRNGPLVYGLSGIDMALWDIAGKRAGQPLYELLGGSAKQNLPAYASLMRYSDAELVARNAARAASQGFRYIKLHEIGVEQARAAREAIGPSVALMLDTNCPWSLQEALEMAERLSPLDLYWLEEPCWPPENFAALAGVRSAGQIPIAAGENNTTAMGFLHMFQAGAVDFAQPSPAKLGITEARKVFALAEAFNVRLAPHTPYFGPGLLAGLQLNAAHPAADMLVEWFYFDLETTLYGDAILPRNGCISIPRGSGLGLDPDAAVLAKYAC